MKFFCSCILALSLLKISAIEIELRYDFDTNGFFNQPGSKEALRAVADFYEEIFEDSLEAIVPSGSDTWIAIFFDPASGNVTQIENLIVPQDTVIIYAGGRDLGGARGRAGPGIRGEELPGEWRDLLDSRGQPGALATPRTDFAPWGGSVAFDLNSVWNFQMDGRPANSTVSSFVAVALHELGHIFGIGTADSWDAHINSSFQFTGQASVNAFGGLVPIQILNASDGSQVVGGHWEDDGVCLFPNGFDPNNMNGVLSRTYGSFGREHGELQVAIMDPRSCTISTHDFFSVLTDVDIAGFVDIGWEVNLPFSSELTQSNPPSLSYNTNSIYSYKVQRSSDLNIWLDLESAFTGNAEEVSFTDNSALADVGFYRVARTDLYPQPNMNALTNPVLPQKRLQTEAVSIMPREVTGCFERDHVHK